MRILTVRQPWAWAIVHGGKDVENRVRNIAGGYRGPVAIHAAQAWAEVTYGEYLRLRRAGMVTIDTQPRGVIVGVVDLVDVHEDTGPDSYTSGPCDCTSRWADAGVFHLVLANPRPLSEPIPYKGALGLRTVPAELRARIEAAL